MRVLSISLCLLDLLTFGSAGPLMVSVHDGGDVLCNDELSADGLTRAVDAALMELNTVKGFYEKLKVDFPSALMVDDCTSNEDHWPYPDAATATGLLKRVLDSGELRVAGVQWGPYKADPPSGFWPDYGTAIAEMMSAHYGKSIKIVRVYYDTSKIVTEKVAEGIEVDMSEPYYYLSGFHEISPSKSAPRIEHFAFSCITAATTSSFFTKKDSGITTLAELNEHIRTHPNERKIGFIGQGNYDSVSGILAEEAVPQIGDQIEDQIDSDKIEARVATSPLLLIAGYSSEGPEGVGDSSNFNVFSTGIVSPRVILFRQDNPTCESQVDSPSSTPAVVAIAVLGVISILLALVLVVGVCKERQGTPLFMPIIDTAKKPPMGVEAAA